MYKRQPLFKEKNTSGKKKNSRLSNAISQIFIGLIFVSSIAMAFILNENSHNMIKIEKTIFEKSIKQDIDKMKMDKNLLDMAIKKG